jgi:putative membrane protein
MPPIAFLDRDLIGFGWVGELFELLFGLLVVAALVTVIVLGISMLRQRRTAPAATTPASSSATAVAVLDERFAKGEIDEEDYRSRRALLLGGQA